METIVAYLIAVGRIAVVGVLFALLWDGFDRWLAGISQRFARRVIFLLVMMSLGRPVIIRRAYLLLMGAYVVSIFGLNGILRFLPLNGLAQFCAQLACFLIAALVVWNKQNYLLPDKRAWAILVFALLFGIDWLLRRMIDGVRYLADQMCGAGIV